MHCEIKSSHDPLTGINFFPIVRCVMKTSFYFFSPKVHIHFRFSINIYHFHERIMLILFYTTHCHRHRIRIVRNLIMHFRYHLFSFWTRVLFGKYLRTFSSVFDNVNVFYVILFFISVRKTSKEISQKTILLKCKTNESCMVQMLVFGSRINTAKSSKKCGIQYYFLNTSRMKISFKPMTIPTH